MALERCASIGLCCERFGWHSATRFPCRPASSPSDASRCSSCSTRVVRRCAPHSELHVGDHRYGVARHSRVVGQACSAARSLRPMTSTRSWRSTFEDTTSRKPRSVDIMADASSAYALDDADHLAQLDPFCLTVLEQPEPTLVLASRWIANASRRPPFGARSLL